MRGSVTLTEAYEMGPEDREILTKIINDNLENCYKKIDNLIDAELNNGPKDYDKDYIRNHVEKLTI